MGDSDAVTKAKIHYYCREKYYRAMQNAAVEGLKKFSGDSVYTLFYGLSLILEGRVQEGIRELDPLQNDNDVMLGAMLALIYAHRRCLNIDREAVTQLDSKLKEERKKAGDQALYYAGLFLFHTGRYDKAREYVDRMLKLNSQSREGQVIKGWTELFGGKDGKSKHSIQYFDNALSSNSRDIDALFGKAKYYELRHNFEGTIEVLNQLIVTYSTFTPPLVEKMKIQLALQDWDHAVDIANRVLTADHFCLEAQRYKILQTVCREGNYDETSNQLSRFYDQMEKMEPKNAGLFMENAQLFSRLCGRANHVLTETYRFAEKAAQLDSNSSEFMTELGYQCLLQGRVKEALKFYKNATKLDESSVPALTGIISCQLMEGQLDVAEQQLEFLKEIQRSIGTTSEILYLSAILSSKRNKSAEEILGLLNEAVESHFRCFRALHFGPQYLSSLNPDFLIQLVREYLLYAPTQPASQGQPSPPALKRSMSVLEPVTKACPGLLEALFLLSKVKFLSGDIKSSASTLQHILDHIDPTFADAHLLMAQIQLHQGNYMQAQQSLEVGLSYNFEVRDHPLYHLINAQVLKKQENVDEAIKTLQVAMGLTGVKPTSASRKKSKIELTTTDRVSVYLELAEAYRLNDQHHEAAKIMQDAINEFHGTAEEVRITVANADLSLARGDTELALSMLRNVGSTQPYYLQAREKMANIYLQHRKDKRLFASCYREVVEKCPSPQSYLLLGDAYMSIQEPDRAIEVYEQALKRNPRDATLASKMGQALVKTHQYGKAINYYKEAIKNENNSSLRYDMAELQMKLRQYDKAEKTLLQALEHEGVHTSNDIGVLISESKLLVLLSKVQEKSGNLEAAVATLMKGRDVQSRILKRVQVEQPDGVIEQKQLAACICRQISEHAGTQRDYEKAIRFYKEALGYIPDDQGALVALAKLYMTVNDLDQCQYTCMTLLRSDKENEAATVMMADLAFRKNDYETAMFHFQQLLDRKPDYWAALARLVEVMRRTGNLGDVPPYLEKAENSSTRAVLEPGLSFCKGLYEWYAGNPNTALKYFNKARKDNDWGQRAIYSMIEICLNPDNDMLGGEVFDSFDPEGQYDARDSQEMALRTAEKLLKELKPKPGEQTFSHQLLNNFLLLATKQKPNIERALQEFMSLAGCDMYRDHVGAILGMATAYMLLKQTPRARNQLKRAAKSSWNFEDAEYLERCWMLLADIYVQSGKYDMATELLRKVLHHNKSATKAYEYMGFIMEKEQSYRDAAMHYEQAWRFSNKTTPAIGYKLAFNYMKAKRYVDAIDVCHAVLAKHPNYPKIKKDIMDKSRSNLRV